MGKWIEQLAWPGMALLVLGVAAVVTIYIGFWFRVGQNIAG